MAHAEERESTDASIVGSRPEPSAIFWQKEKKKRVGEGFLSLKGKKQSVSMDWARSIERRRGLKGGGREGSDDILGDKRKRGEAIPSGPSCGGAVHHGRGNKA